MKKFITIGYIIGVLLIVCIATIIVSINSVEKVYINKDSSYFSDFIVENDKVYIRCSITIKNTYKADKTVILSANMTDDVNTGLLNEAKIYSLNEDGSISDFIIKGESQQTFNVVFTGDFAGTNIKHDKLLPDITIDIVN